MTTLEFITNKYKLDINQKHQPIEIPNTDRGSLADLFNELAFTHGAEVGVEQGIYSEVLLKANKDLKLIAVDAWQVFPDYRDHMEQSEMDALYAITKQRLHPYATRCSVVKALSVDLAKQVPNESLDFVYLDANHEFAHVVEDLAAWEPKVKVGGIIAGHDYIKRRTNAYLMHVPYAVDAWCDAYQIKPLFVLGRKEAPKGEKRDRTRSWFYVKPERDPMKPGWKGWQEKLTTAP